MVAPTAAAGVPERAPRADKFYFAAWRWHFYAGLFVIPFLVMLATTGLLMLWISVLSGRDGEAIAVVPQATAVPIEAQAEAAVAAVPGGTLAGYIAPAAPDRAALFKVGSGEDALTLVAIDPFTGAVIGQHPFRAGWYDTLNTIHGTLLIGTVGDRLIETAASLGIVLIATGLYLWWPRTGGLGAALVPNFRGAGTVALEVDARDRRDLVVGAAPRLPDLGPVLGRGLGREVRTGVEHVPGGEVRQRAAFRQDPRQHEPRRRQGGPLGARADADAGLGLRRGDGDARHDRWGAGHARAASWRRRATSASRVASSSRRRPARTGSGRYRATR